MSFDVITLGLAKSYTDQHGGGGGQVQPDWNQNNETASDYVKNRPFYTGNPVEAVLVEESTVTFADEGGLYGAEVISTFLATVGETYKVSWDGTVYESVCADYRAGLFAIGNLSIAGAGADTGEPFLIVPNGSSIFIYTPDTSNTHTFSISGLVTEVIKIPDKYISDTFRDVVISGNPLDWSEDHWAKYYGLFKSGKLLMINGIGNSNSEGYVLSMVYTSAVYNMSAISSTGGLYKLDINKGSEKDKFYWTPIISYNDFYFQYQQSGSDHNPTEREAYKRLEVSDGLTFTTKNANQEAVTQKVVLEGDKEIILSSSTSGSTKKFKITVDDDYNVSATNTSDSVSKTLATTEYVDSSVSKSNPLNITGATVGQIAKITAVDDSGKPTAWEAVDMLSGGGGGGSVPAAGGVTTLHINVTAVNMETMESTFTADKTPTEMKEAAATGPVWCVVTFDAGLMGEKAVSVGVPPTWYGLEPAFGCMIALIHNENGANKIGYAVRSGGSNSWIVDLTQFAS